MDELTVGLCAPDLDGVVCAALVGRRVRGPVEMQFRRSQDLAGFFADDMQRKLPNSYRLVICGPAVVHADWDGRVIRPRLIEALRAFIQPVEWFSARPWAPEDVATAAHIVGEERLHVEPATSCAALVRRALARPDDPLAETLQALAEGRAQEEWAGTVEHAVRWLKDEPAALGRVGALLSEGRPADLPEALLHRASAREAEVRREAEAPSGEPTPVGAHTLCVLPVKPARWPFWQEMARTAMDARGAEFCLCLLEGRSALMLCARADVPADLGVWVRYVTDMLPGLSVVDELPGAVVLCAPGLPRRPDLKDEIVRLLAEGAHLLGN